MSPAFTPRLRGSLPRPTGGEAAGLPARPGQGKRFLCLFVGSLRAPSPSLHKHVVFEARGQSWSRPGIPRMSNAPDRFQMVSEATRTAFTHRKPWPARRRHTLPPGLLFQGGDQGFWRGDSQLGERGSAHFDRMLAIKTGAAAELWHLSRAFSF